MTSLYQNPSKKQISKAISYRTTSERHITWLGYLWKCISLSKNYWWSYRCAGIEHAFSFVILKIFFAVMANFPRLCSKAQGIYGCARFFWGQYLRLWSTGALEYSNYFVALDALPIGLAAVWRELWKKWQLSWHFFTARAHLLRSAAQLLYRARRGPSGPAEFSINSFLPKHLKNTILRERADLVFSDSTKLVIIFFSFLPLRRSSIYFWLHDYLKYVKRILWRRRYWRKACSTSENWNKTFHRLFEGRTCFAWER